MTTNANHCCNSLNSSSNRIFSPLLLQQPQTLQKLQQLPPPQFQPQLLLQSIFC